MIQDPVLKNGWGVGPFKIIGMSSREASAQPKIKIQGGKTQFGRVHLTLRKCKSNPTPLSLFEASTVQRNKNMFQYEHGKISGSVCFTNHLVPCTSQKGKKQTNLNKPSYLLLVFAFEVSGFKFGQHFQVTGRKLLNFVQDKFFSI